MPGPPDWRTLLPEPHRLPSSHDVRVETRDAFNRIEEKRMELLVVILNYNGLEHTLACLDSLHRQTRRDFSIQVIDNGSACDDMGRITSRFPEVDVVLLPVNKGWAGGNNVGLRTARDQGFKHVCLLNNDTVLDSDTFAEMLSAAYSFGRPCLLQPTIAYFDDPTRWQINPSAGVTNGNDDRLNMVEMDFAYGACLLFSRVVLNNVGMLDERFFLQLEEADYFHRAKALCIPSICVRNARILHKESVAFGGLITPDKTYYQVRNSLLLAEKHALTPLGILHALRRLFWMLHGQARKSDPEVDRQFGFIRWIMSANPLARAARQGGSDYLRRRFGPRPR